MRHSFLHRADASNGKGANRNEGAEKRKRKAANYEYGGADKNGVVRNCRRHGHRLRR